MLIQRLAAEAVTGHDARAFEKQKDEFDALDVSGIVSDDENVKDNLVWAVKSVKSAALDAASRKDLDDDQSGFADRLEDLRLGLKTTGKDMVKLLDKARIG